MDKINLSGIPRCNQIWENMQPIEGGRLCAQCNKCIVDFREKSYLEIAIIRATSPAPVCGIYTEEQLTFNSSKPRLRKKNPFHRAFAFSATLLSMLAKIQAQDGAEKVLFTEKLVLLEKPYNHHAIQKETKQTKIKNEVDTIIFKGKIIDAIDSTGLIGATVLVKGYTMGTVTEIDGSFQLALSSDFNEGKPVTFSFSSPGFYTQEKEYQLDTLNNFSELIALQPGMMPEFVVTSREYQVIRWRLWFREFWRRFGF